MVRSYLIGWMRGSKLDSGAGRANAYIWLKREDTCERCWIVVAEGNEFDWPGYDLRKIGRSDRYDYGFLPPRFFNQVIAAFAAWHRARKATLTSRERSGYALAREATRLPDGQNQRVGW
jgi:hypothetical protein